MIKTAVVTGVTGGIGKVVAFRLLREGYRVLGISRGDNHKILQAEAEEVCGKSTSLYLFPCDLSHYHDVITCAENMDVLFGTREEKIDILAFCHGAKPNIKPFENRSVAEWEMIMKTDVTGSFYLVKELIRSMKSPGSIVFLSSFHAFGTYPERAPYTTAKAAIVGFAKGLAVEYAQYGLRANCICPGQVEGDRTSNIGNGLGLGEYTKIKMQRRSPSGKLVDPVDIASTILWLANTPGVNGQSIVIDHGVSSSYYYNSYSVE